MQNKLTKQKHSKRLENIYNVHSYIYVYVKFVHCWLLHIYLGMFAYVDAATAMTQLYAFFGITGLTAGEDYCLEFYYHMYGSDIDLLVVTVNVYQAPLFEIQGGRSRCNAGDTLAL